MIDNAILVLSRQEVWGNRGVRRHYSLEGARGYLRMCKHIASYQAFVTEGFHLSRRALIEN